MDLIHTFTAISDMIMLIIIREIVSRSGVDVWGSFLNDKYKKQKKKRKYLMVNQCHLVDENGSYRINIFCWGMKLSPVG